MIKKIKIFIGKTPLFFPLRNLLSFFEYLAVVSSRQNNTRTKCYCISPYKTATTYLNNIFQDEFKTTHEPLQHLTLKKIDDIKFLEKRSDYLSLDIEFSGFFAGRLSTIRSFDSDAKVLYVYRPFKPWIKSYLNHHIHLDRVQGYPYTSILHAEKIIGFKINKFLTSSREEKINAVQNLYAFWVSVYEESLAFNNTKIIHIQEIDKKMNEIQDFFQLRLKKVNKNVWKREASEQFDLMIDDIISNQDFKTRQHELELRLFS